MKTAVLIFLASSLIVAGCSRTEEEAQIQPGETGPGPLQEGAARLTPEASSAIDGETFTVRLDVSSGQETLGAFSTCVYFNRAAFDLVSVDGVDPVLSAPFLNVETSPGCTYIAWTNTSPPDDALTGVRHVATLTFRATGSEGSRLNISAKLLGMGDTEFPGKPIGFGGFPRDVEVIGDVVIAAQ